MDLVMGVCDLIHVLEFGKVIATGTAAEVRANRKVQAAYLGFSDSSADMHETQEMLNAAAGESS
jgi:branched-chain amino acid transport system ATP-binding protein